LIAKAESYPAKNRVYLTLLSLFCQFLPYHIVLFFKLSKFFARINSGTFVARLKLPSKILTPYGDTEKNFKFLQRS